MSSKNNDLDIERNIRIHNRVAKKYARIHGEIYNDIEQNRLKNALETALTYVETDSSINKALDFGCGAGNLTTHLSAIGCEVISCDVSQGFLDLINSGSYNTKVKTVLLNGKDLSGVPDNSVDLVATYSVLHHVPDYLTIVKELVRVLKVGGVLYIDHERSDGFWLNNGSFKKFDKKMRSRSKLDFRKYFVVTNYIDWFIRKFLDSRYRREGDIHVFPDDHIEWCRITDVLVDRKSVV